MTKQESSLNLRLKAEDAVKKRSIQVPNTLNSESVIDLHKMVHELQVHQVELEMQAEELQETQAALQQANQELERRVLEQTRQLRESEERFAAFMSHLPAAAFIKDTCGRILYANKYLQDLLNFQKWEVKTTQELVPEEVQQQMVEDDRKALAQGQIKTQETMTVSDGSRRTFETIKFAIRGEGIPALLGGIAFDITERKQAELELKISRDFLQGLIDRIADPVVVKDKRHRFALVNDAECMLAGQSREMLLGKTDLDFFPKEQVDVFWKMDVRVLETGEAHLNEETIQHGSTGESLTFLSHKTRYVDQCGNRFVVAVLSDITERKRAEVMLRGSEERFRNLLQTIPSVAVQGYSIDGTTQYWNQASEQLYGYSANDVQFRINLWSE
jgi:PAS domain S-box-containing protein